MSIVADYSAGKPGAAALKRAGFIGAVRYIGQPDWTKNTSAAELRDFNEHGLGMALVFELTAGGWRGGYAAGVSDARAARKHADAIGFPEDRPIYMAIDQDVVTEAEYGQVKSYLDGAASVLGKDLTGPYGEYEVCRRSAEWGFVWQWQCRAWSGTPPQIFGAHRLFQYYGSPYTSDGKNAVVNGIEVDTNEVNHPDWGQHTAEGLMNMNREQMEELATLIAEKINTDVVWGPRYGEAERNFADMATERTQRLIDLSDKIGERLDQVVNLLDAILKGQKG